MRIENSTHPNRRRRGITAALVGAASVALVAGCASGGTAESQVSATSNNVAFNACNEQLCAGTIDNKFQFKIAMPKKWNGTLLLYSHQFRANVPVPLGTAVAGVDPLISPTGLLGKADVGENLLDAGFALAGAASPELGWRVGEQIEAADALYGYFSDKIAKPNRVYTWGPSTGALASLNLAQNRDWVSGTAPLCGNLAGLTRNFDIALDAAYSVRQLLYPGMKLANYLSLKEAKGTYNAAMKRVRAAAKDSFGPGAQKLVVLGLAAVVPSKTSTLPGAGIAGEAKAIAANLEVILARSTIDRFALEQQYGGNPSANVGTDYNLRASRQAVQDLEKAKPGAYARYMKPINRGTRVPADASARTKANESAGATGNMRVPMVSLHTAYDALAIVQNEGAIITATREAGSDDRQLVQANVVSPPPFSKEGVLTVGSGHCSFTPDSVAGTIVILDKWVREGLFPSDASTADLLGPGSGYTPRYPHLKWPAGPTEPAN